MYLARHEFDPRALVEHFVRHGKLKKKKDRKNRLRADERPDYRDEIVEEEPHGNFVWANVAFWSDKL